MRVFWGGTEGGVFNLGVFGVEMRDFYCGTEGVWRTKEFLVWN